MQAHSVYDSTDHFKHNLAVGDVLALTALHKNGWSEGFKLSDPTHTHRLFPNGYVRAVRLQLALKSADTAFALDAQGKPEPAVHPALEKEVEA